MKRLLLVVVLCVLAAALGAGLALAISSAGERKPPETPAVVEQMRDVARLQTLQLRLYKRISFEPDPRPSETVWGDLANWVRLQIRKPQGRAIVFADVELGLDLQKLRPETLRVRGRRVEVQLPPLEASVRLLPGETEFIGSNLDSEETAQLFDRAREAFHREVMGDARLRERARRSAEHSLRGLLYGLGFEEVVFVDTLPAPAAG